MSLPQRGLEGTFLNHLQESSTDDTLPEQVTIEIQTNPPRPDPHAQSVLDMKAKHDDLPMAELLD